MVTIEWTSLAWEALESIFNYIRIPFFMPTDTLKR